MGTITRARFLTGAFCLSLCGLGLTVGASMRAQTTGGTRCPLPVCAAPAPGCEYVRDSAVDANGCPLRPCGELKCKPSPSVSCGNRVVDAGEQCDDGNAVDNDGCSKACKIEKCGDGVRQEKEQCDAGSACNSNPSIACTLDQDCRACLVSPNGTLRCGGSNTGKTCTSSSDCIAETNIACVYNATKECTSECKTGITAPSCGNRVIDAGEQCDDGNRKPGDGCNSACKKETCGDGIVTPSLGEECDTKQLPTNREQPYEGCDASCKITYCGDGVVQSELKETCDDRNGVNGDGCSALCQKEQGISTCSDTDGGMRTDVAGTVSGTFNGNAYSSSDMCEGTSVVEYYCNGVSAARVLEKCANGCENGACKKAADSRCAVVTPKGKAMQNQKNPTDVNDDGKTDFWDVRAIYGYYNEEPIGPKTAAKPYMNVDGSTNLLGRETFDIQDILYVVNNVNYCNLPAEKKLNLASVTMGCEANVNVAKVSYDKNFEGCAHVVSADGKRLDSQNVLCPNAGPISIPLAKLAISSNQSVKICDATDYSKCSQPVTVTGSPCGTLPPSIAIGSAVISCNPEKKTIFSVNYQATNVNSNFLHLVDEQQKLRHTTNLFLSNQVQTSAPIGSFIDIAPGLKLKLCTTNYGTCSSAIEVSGKGCDTTTPPSPITLTSASFSCTSTFTTSATIAYAAKDASKLILMLDNGSWLYNGADITGGKTSATVTTFENVPVPAGSSVKLCDSMNRALCSSAVTVAGAGCSKNISLAGVALTMNGGVPSAKVAYTKDSFPTCLHMFIASDKSKTLHSVNYFCSTTGETKTVPLGPTAGNPKDGLKVKEGDIVVLCHGNNANLCSAPVTVTKEATPVATTLSIATKNIGSSDTSVRNEKNVALLRFEARAGNGDAVLTNVIARASAGSLQNAQNYSMWVDSDGDSVTDLIIGRTTPSENLLKFNPIHVEGVLIKKDTPLLFEIRADIASSPASNQIQLDLATSTANYVSAQTTIGNIPLVGIKTNGMCEGTCAISVTTVPSILRTIANQGDLFVTLDSTPTRSRQILGGTLSDTVLRLQLRAQYEDVDVTDLQFTSRGSNASSIERLDLYKDGVATAFASATVSGCGADQVNRTDRGLTVSVFCVNMENSQLVVKDGENFDVLVRARVKSDNDGAISGEPFQLFLSPRAVSNDATGEGAVRARGKTSTNNLAANDGNTLNEGEVFIGTDSATANAEIAGNMNTVVLSKIMSIANASPTPDNSAIPIGVARIGEFKFTAMTNTNSANGLNKPVINTILFSVSSSNIAMDMASFKIYNKKDSSASKPCTVVGGGGTPTSSSYVIACENLDASGAIDVELDELSPSEILVLEGNITNPKTVPSANSSLQVSLQNFSAPYPAASNILWTDKDAVGTIQYKWIEYSDTVVRSTYYKS